MGFFTKEGILWIAELVVLFASVTGRIHPQWLSLLAGFSAVLYTFWYFHFCYIEAIKNSPELTFQIYSKLNGGK